jgi:ferredoxin
MCRRCETVCSSVQTVGALTGYGRGFSAKVGTASMIPLADTSCTFCGQCVNVCPVGAITGELKKTFSIDPNVCIRCGACINSCRKGAVVVE